MEVIYIIRQAAVYWHNIIEVHSDKARAIERCKVLSNADCDDHHLWVVTRHKVGVEVQRQEFKCRHEWVENETEVEIFEARKGE